MSDPWQDESFGAENDWDEGEESLEIDLEDGLAAAGDELDEAGWDEIEGE